MKAWLSEFLFIRECFAGPTGKPLYSYHVTFEEFQSLKNKLIANIRFATDPIKGKHWAELYCLFVAERFRRDYGAEEGSWSWEWADKPLGCDFKQGLRSELISYGLESFWKRPIRRTEKGRNFIGSLFLEGGLPWPLIKSETHGFGRVIRKGLKNYHSNKASLGTTSDMIASYEQDLPYTFHNLETRQLLAGVIEQLMHLAGKYPSLKQEIDPVEFLDKAEPRWKKDFPLPLNEANAKNLITDWLRDASKRQAENEIIKKTPNDFRCTHSIAGQVEGNWDLQAQLITPIAVTFPVDISALSSTRLEMAFYEGSVLIARGSIVYGEVQNGTELKVRLPRAPVVLKRRDCSESLSLALMDNGVAIYQTQFDASSIDFETAPVIFEVSGDQELLANASCSLRQPAVLVRLPTNADFTPAESVEIKHTQTDGVRWVLLSQETSIFLGSDKFRVRLNHPSVTQTFALDGKLLDFDSLPNAVYLGWPKLCQKSNEGSVYEYINGELVARSQREIGGVFNYTLKNSSGEILFRRKFGVLPDSFKVRLFAGDATRPARLEIMGGDECKFGVTGENISSRLEIIEGRSVISLSYRGAVPPSNLQLSIKGGEFLEPVILRLPFPYEGARLLDSSNNILTSESLIPEDLIGLSILLFSAGETQSFHLRMELQNKNFSTNVYLDYRLFKSGDVPLSVNLFAYQNDLRQIMAAMESQDAYVKLTVESPQRRLMTVNIKRYNGSITKDSTEVFTVSDFTTGRVASGVNVSAMLLSDPKQTPIELRELTSQGVGTGRFVTDDSMYRDGPWLLYPEAESRVKFRPYLLVGQPASNTYSSGSKIHSLHEAARLYHPQNNPHVIDDQIAEMGSDLDHSGWQYLDDIKRKFDHLPLSTFESWLSLSRNPLTLAVSILRLEVDELFSDRMRDELSIIWESISLPIWSQAYKNYDRWLRGMGLPEFVINDMVDNRKAVLSNIVSGFESVEHYLSSGNNEVLTSLPPDLVLPMWRDTLHESYQNTLWPKYLNGELSAWVEQQDFSKKIKALPLEKYEDSVVYLPIFMAYVTSGKSSIADLKMNSTMAELKFFVRKISDFDRASWYRPAHALVTSYLLNKNDKD